MALQFNELVTLAKTVARANPAAPVAYSFNNQNFGYSEMNETLRSELRELAPTYREYKKNQNTIFALMEEVIDDVLPQKVLDQYGQFAEVKTFAQGDKPVFTQRITSASRRRARQFIGKVGLAGLYEVFRLEGATYEVPTEAIGGAAQIGFEEFLDGRADLATVLEVVLEGIDECIYIEILKQLVGAAQNIPASRKYTGNTFDESKMDELLSYADSYAHATIYCTYEFAATMIPATGWVSEQMKNDKWQNGYLGNYKGHQVIVLRQSYDMLDDGTNTMKKVLDPAYAWIIPTGADKPVKIAFEGNTIVDEFTNYDRSREVQIYKKVGVRTIMTNDICVYQNTALTR